MYDTAMMEKVAVLGDGAWGTALAGVLASNHASVIQWSRSPEQAVEMQTTRENRRYLPGVRLSEGITVTSQPDAFAHADLILCAVPSAHLREVLGSMREHLGRGRPFISVTKGLEFPSRLRATEVIREVIGDRAMAVLSGPSHAEEVAQGMPTAVVAASEDRGLAMRVQDLLTTDRFRVYTSDDPIGTELGGALKNVLSIAGGLVDGLGFGDNTKAALLTRGLAEMTRLGEALGGRADSFQGLSGIGDLVVSCVSRHGRNRLVGERIARGETLEAVLEKIPGVPEGVRTARAVVELAAEHHVEIPISAEVAAVLFEDKDPATAVQDLMTRPQRDEISLP